MIKPGVGNDFFPGGVQGVDLVLELRGGIRGVDLVLELRGVSGGWIFGPKSLPILTKIQILAYFRPKTH